MLGEEPPGRRDENRACDRVYDPQRMLDDPREHDPVKTETDPESEGDQSRCDVQQGDVHRPQEIHHQDTHPHKLGERVGVVE